MRFEMADGHNLWATGGYTVNNPAAWAPPVIPSGSTTQRYDQPMRSVKRPLSESDDCEDVFSEESKERCSSPNEDCQMGFSRKKRRGIIEKRRRDRINSSLSELRRLVPTAFEKQGSAKLEKAEILQMTVDHLKSLHSKGKKATVTINPKLHLQVYGPPAHQLFPKLPFGHVTCLDALAYDPHKFAMDYHSIGFRECAAEVARYLVTVEGMDIQDPLRLRLMSHLQCFAAQRELASKQASTAWNYNTYGSIHDYPTANSYDVPPTQHHQPLPPHHISSIPPTSSSHIPQPTINRQQAILQPSDNRLQSQALKPDHLEADQMVRHPSGDSLSPDRHLQQGDSNRQIQNGIPTSYQSHHSYSSGFSQQGYNTSGQVKPYRPWGAEVAY